MSDDSRKALEDYFSWEPSRKRKAERGEIDLVALAQYATEMLDQLLSLYKKDYEDAGGSLTLQWSWENGFAWVNAIGEGEPIHEVIMNEAYLIHVTCNAFSAHLHITHGLRSPASIKVLEENGIMPTATGYLYPGIDPLIFRNTLRSNSLLFIISHEMAHLLQFHVIVRDGTDWKEWMAPRRMHASGTDEGEKRTGELAEIYQATELAADYEAVVKLTLYIMAVKVAAFKAGQVKEPFITKADVWVMMVAMFCVFMDFHVKPGEPFTGNIVGDHPHPAVRYRLAITTLIRHLVVNLREFNEVIFTEENLNEVHNHAFWVSSCFWTERYGNKEALDNFTNAVIEYDSVEAKSFFSAIVPRWDEIRPIIKKHYPDKNYIMIFDDLARRLSGTSHPTNLYD